MTTTLKPSPIIANRYQLLETLAETDSWIECRALDRLGAKTVLLRRYLPTHTRNVQDVRFIQRLTRQIHVFTSIRHPNLRDVYDFGVDSQKNPFFTMEDVADAPTLIDSSRKLDIRSKIDLLLQALRGLSYLHHKRVSHRALQVETIRVLPGQQVKLALPLLDVEHGEMPGGANNGFGADQHALGMIAYTLLVGRSSGVDFKFSHERALAAGASGAVSAVIAKMLAAKPDQRYESLEHATAALCEAVGLPSERETVGLSGGMLLSTEFVGREAEFSRLRLAMEQAVRGQGKAWLVGGESGVGKSRLLDELSLFASNIGALTLRGQGIVEGGLPYQLWRDPVRQLVLTPELQDSDASVLKELVPDIESILRRRVADAPLLEGTDNQNRLISTIMRLLLRQNQPVLLILEDLQWAIESLEPLKPLTALIRDMPLLLVCSYRDDEVPTLPDRLPMMEHMHLTRFDMSTTRRLSDSLLRHVHPDTAAWIQRETEGNVFFIIEAARALLDDSHENGCGGEKSHSRLLEEGIQRSLQRRLERLPAEALPILCFAATTGRRIDVELLRTAFPNVDLDSWLILCDRAAVLHHVGGQWSFAHDRLREAILATIDPSERRRLHRSIAQTIEQLRGEDVSQVFILYEHWQASGDEDKRRDYAYKAGLERKRLSSYAQARILLEESLQLTAVESPIYTSVLLNLGEVCSSSGDAEAAAAYLNQAITHAEKQGDVKTFASALFWLSQIDAVRGNYDSARMALLKAYAITPASDSETLARLYYGLGDVAWRKNQLTEAANYIHQSLRMARSVNNLTLIMYALNRLGSIHFFQNELNVAEQYHRENRGLALSVGNRERAIAAVGNLGEIARLREDFEQAGVLYTEALAIAREIGHRHYMTLLYGYLGLNALAMMHLSEAENYLTNALRLAVEQQSAALILASMIGFTRLRFVQRDYDSAAKWLGLILNHSATDVNIRNDAQNLSESLQSVLPAPVFEQRLTEGQQIDLFALANQLIGEQKA